MTNKRPLTSANSNVTNNGGKALRFDISQIKPVIMKRSEIYNKGSSISNKATGLQSCLRQSRTSWATQSQPFSVNDACSVQFRTKVAVRRIPSRHDYSESVRAELWSSLQEIRKNALRNEAEFSFDGAQWRNCSEEEDFFYDKRSGSLVHPAHVETVCVFDGVGWKPISTDEPMLVSTTPEPPTHLDAMIPPNQVCIVCDFGRE